MPFFANVAVNLPLNQSFTYSCDIEGEDEGRAFGRRVQVPFGSRRIQGIVTGSSSELPPDCAIQKEKIRKIIRFIDEEPILTKELYALARWVSLYYISSIGESLFAMLPSGKRETAMGGLPFSDGGEAWDR